MMIAINNRDLKMIKFLWEDLRLLWDAYHLHYVLEEMSIFKYKDGVEYLLSS